MTELDIVAELDRWIAYWRNDHDGAEHPFDDQQPTRVLQRARDALVALQEQKQKDNAQLAEHGAVVRNVMAQARAEALEEAARRIENTVWECTLIGGKQVYVDAEAQAKAIRALKGPKENPGAA